MIPHRTHRPDNNRDEIVEAIEKLGWSVLNTGMVGEGFPDLIIVKLKEHIYTSGGFELHHYNWVVRLIEIKSLKGKYTPKEQAFMDRFPGLVITLRSVEDVIKEFGDAPDVSAKTGDNWKYGWDG